MLNQRRTLITFSRLFLGLLIALYPPIAWATPWIHLLRIGAEPVRGSFIALNSPEVELIGEAADYMGGEFAAYARPRGGGDRRWVLLGTARAEAGGTFSVRAQFSRAGEYEVVVALMSPAQHSVDERIGDDQLRKSLGISQPASVTVGPFAPYDPENGGTSAVWIKTIAGAAPQANQLLEIGASGPVVVGARSMPVHGKPYVMLHASFTDQCVIYGPGKYQSPGEYLFTSIPFEAQADPAQAHLEVWAFWSTTDVRSGPVSCEASRNWRVRISPVIPVVVGQKSNFGDGQRVPFIAVTRIGHHNLAPGKRSDRVLAIHSGDSVEIGQFDRVYEGDHVFIGTRPRGSAVWLIQGPAIKRGGASPPAGKQLYPRVTWVWLDLRLDPVPEGKESDYELVAVLSPTLLPNAHVPTTFLTSQRVQTVSEVIALRADDAPAASDGKISALRVDGTDVTDGGEVSVGSSASVDAEISGKMPEGSTLVTAVHRLGAENWVVVPMTRTDTGYTAADVPFDRLANGERADFAVMVMATSGHLPFGEYREQDLLTWSLINAIRVSAHYGNGMLAGWMGRRRPPPTGDGFEEFGLAPGAGPQLASFGPSLPGWALLIVAALILGLLFFLGRSVNRSVRAQSERNGPKFELGAARFTLGTALCAVVLYMLNTHYVSFYASVIQTVTNQSRRHSMDMAIWLTLIGCVLGIFIHFSHEMSRYHSGGSEVDVARFYRRICAAALAIAALLWLFEGGLYYQMLAINSFGAVPLLGGIAFTLIAIAETLVFFLIARLVLPPLRRHGMPVAS